MRADGVEKASGYVRPGRRPCRQPERKTMKPEREAAERLLYDILDMGEMLLSSGAEIKRVEDTLNRLGRAYGAVECHVFVITASIMASMEFPGRRRAMGIRRIAGAPKNDFRKLEALNLLSRRCCAAAGRPVPVSQLEEELLRWKRGENIRERYVGSLIVTGSFALYFGGTVADGLAAVAFAPLVCFLQVRFERFFPNKVTFYVFCSFLTGILICLGSRLTGWFHYDRVILGDMMLLIPGLALMNSVRDALAGNTISGIMRLTESLIWTGALACGFMAAIWLVF